MCNYLSNDALVILLSINFSLGSKVKSCLLPIPFENSWEHNCQKKK